MFSFSIAMVVWGRNGDGDVEILNFLTRPTEPLGELDRVVRFVLTLRRPSPAVQPKAGGLAITASCNASGFA